MKTVNKRKSFTSNWKLTIRSKRLNAGLMLIIKRRVNLSGPCRLTRGRGLSRLKNRMKNTPQSAAHSTSSRCPTRDILLPKCKNPGQDPSQRIIETPLELRGYLSIQRLRRTGAPLVRISVFKICILSLLKTPAALWLNINIRLKQRNRLGRHCWSK